MTIVEMVWFWLIRELMPLLIVLGLFVVVGGIWLLAYAWDRVGLWGKKLFKRGV